MRLHLQPVAGDVYWPELLAEIEALELFLDTTLVNGQGVNGGIFWAIEFSLGSTRILVETAEISVSIAPSENGWPSLMQILLSMGTYISPKRLSNRPSYKDTLINDHLALLISIKVSDPVTLYSVAVIIFTSSQEDAFLNDWSYRELQYPDPRGYSWGGQNSWRSLWSSPQ